MGGLSKIFGVKNGISNFYKKSYSQDGEDMILRSMFDDLGGRTNGFFVDVGALHPFRLSNTAYFSEAGWRGINIEPSPGAIELFKKYRPHDINLNYGVGEKEDELIFYVFNEPALNTFSKALAEERGAKPDYEIFDRRRISVYPLATVLDKHLPAGMHIDFMTVDVEGLDVPVLRSNNWEKYRPEFILAEDIIDFASLASSEVYNFLTGKGYRLKAKTERTMIFQL